MAYLLSDKVKPPDERIVEQLIDEKSGWHVVTIFARWDGPARLHLNPGVILEGMPLNAPSVPPVEVSDVPEGFASIHEEILAVTPGPNQRGISLRTISRLCEHSGGHFKEAVRFLIDHDFLAAKRYLYNRTDKAVPRE